MTDTEHQGSLPAIIDRLRDIDEIEIIDLGGGHKAIAKPAGRTIESLKSLIDEYHEDAPERIKTRAPMLTAESFAAYLTRFKTDDTAVFVIDSPDKPSMLGVIDYHGQGGEAAPRFGVHRVAYSFPLSDQMRAWIAASKNGTIGQAEFATFLQDREYDIENPPVDWMQIEKAQLDLVLDLLNLHDDKGVIDDGADDQALVAEGFDPDETYIPRSAVYKLRKLKIGNAQRLQALARGIEITTNAKATSAYDPKSGARTVSFQEEHEQNSRDGRKITVPDLFFIFVPVFEGGARHLLPVRLYYRVVGGNVKWGVQLMDPARMVRLAVKAAADKVAADTSLPVFFGAPES